MEARNQARVHLWFKPRFGADYPPLQSADEPLTHYSSIVHAFGVRLEADGELDVIAPFGLDGMVIRPNRMINNQVSHEAKASRAKDTGEISQFPYKGLLHAWGLRQREARRPQAIYAGRILLSGQGNGVSASEFDPLRCSIPSPWSPSRPGRLARPYPVDDLRLLSFASVT